MDEGLDLRMSHRFSRSAYVWRTGTALHFGFGVLHMIGLPQVLGEEYGHGGICVAWSSKAGPRRRKPEWGRTSEDGPWGRWSSTAASASPGHGGQVHRDDSRSGDQGGRSWGEWLSTAAAASPGHGEAKATATKSHGEEEPRRLRPGVRKVTACLTPSVLAAGTAKGKDEHDAGGFGTRRDGSGDDG